MINETNPEDLQSLVEIAGQKVPNTLIIGCCMPPPTKRAIDAGALDHLIKPVTRADLKKALQAVGKPVKRVLVVDDDPDALQLFSRMLQVCDSTLEVVIAFSGEQALEKMRDEPPDLVLLDIVMSDMDGWQVLQAMNEDTRIGNIPTPFVSAQDPADQPPVSRYLLATMGEGLPLRKFLNCSLEISSLLLKPSSSPT